MEPEVTVTLVGGAMDGTVQTVPRSLANTGLLRVPVYTEADEEARASLTLTQTPTGPVSFQTASYVVHPFRDSRGYVMYVGTPHSESGIDAIVRLCNVYVKHAREQRKKQKESL